MAESVYKVIELVGTSTDSWEKAAAAAVNRAGETLRDLRIAEVSQLDMQLENGKVRNRMLVRFSPAKGRLRKGVLLPKRFDAIRCVLTYRGMSAEARDLYQDIAKAPGSSSGG